MNINKPIKMIEPYWNYNQVETYLARQLGKDLSFFWEWLLNAEEGARNKCILRFPLAQHLSDPETPGNVKEVLRYMKNEFSEDHMIFWIEW